LKKINHPCLKTLTLYFKEIALEGKVMQ
jgi:hypothetical protein